MKVMFVIARMQYGGAERVMAELANWFAGMGHQVTLVSGYDFPSVYPLDGRIKTLWSAGHQDGKTRPGRMIGFIRDLCRMMEEDRPDAVVSFLTDINIMVIPACKWMRVPVIVSERNDPARNPASRVKRWLRRLTYPFADGFVFQTEQAKSWFSKRIQQKSAVIPNPLLAASLPSPSCGSGKLPGGGLRVVSVGRLEPQKNQKLLISGFAAFARNHPGATLHIYGEGSLREQLAGQIMALGMQNRIFLEGTAADIPAAIHTADIFVLTSDYEGMPNSLLEAMACGLACIAADCPSGGCKTLIRPMHNGILFPVGDEKGLVGALERLAADDQLRRTLAANALQVREEYAGDKINRAWMAYIRRVMEGG